VGRAEFLNKEMINDLARNVGRIRFSRELFWERAWKDYRLGGAEVQGLNLFSAFVALFKRR